MLDQTSENVQSTPENNSEVTEVKKTDNHQEETKEEIVKSSDETDKAVEELETKIAKDAEKEEETDVIPVLDYNSMDLETLVDELSKLVKDQKVQIIKSNVEAIKSVFNKKFGALLAEKKAAFLAEGGDTIDFQYSSPVKSTFNSLLFEYKEKRNAYYSQIEKQLNQNLNLRISIIDELKNLIDNADASTMYKNFKELQSRWNSVGPVPRAKYNDTWRNYHHHVERFYDLLHLNNDFRDLDFKHNLEEKLKLVAQAEALAENEDALYAFKGLQELHRMWKEEIGPVAREFREEVWQKFSVATKKIHENRDRHFKSLKSQFEENMIKKLEVISQLEAYDYSNNKTHSDWQKSMKEFDVLRESFFAIGKVPRVKNNEVWEKFKAATKKFNQAKNGFYKDVKHVQQENLNKKMKLVEQAETLKDSDDFETTTEIMKKIQADWKKIGHVPRKFSDDIWKRFKDACNHYFDRIHKLQDENNKELFEALEKKKNLLEQLSAQAQNNDGSLTLELVKSYINDWRAIGKVPANMRHIENKFNKVLDKLLGNLDIDKTEATMFRFKSLMDNYLEGKNYRKLDGELLFVRKKIDEHVREIQQLENNISFISNATNDNPFVMNVKKSIDKLNKELAVWKLKQVYLRGLDY